MRRPVASEQETMARSLFGQLASMFFRVGRTSADAHLVESILTGNAKSVRRSVQTRARNRAKTALWNAVTEKRRRRR